MRVTWTGKSVSMPPLPVSMSTSAPMLAGSEIQDPLGPSNCIWSSYTTVVLDLDALLAKIASFQRDNGNTDKNVLGHNVTQAEAEEIFFHAPVIMREDIKHSGAERRTLIYGPTNGGRLLSPSFTIRANRMRVISIRDMSRPERRCYAEAP